MAREFLFLVKESALNIPMTSATAGTDSIVLRLTEGNSFSIATEIVVEEIMHGGGLATTAEVISDHYAVKGSLKTKLYPSQAPLLLAWLCNTINGAQTTPWPTTEPPGDLASVSIFHGVQYSNGTIRRKRYSGAKCSGGRIEVSRGSTSAMLTLDIQASKSFGNIMDGSADPTAIEFPSPTEADFPIGPYTFKGTAGGLKIGTVRTAYESLSVAVQNALDGRWFENSYLTINQFCGRKTTLDADLLFKTTPDNRAAYEGLVDQDAELIFSNGTNTAKIDFFGKARISKLSYDLGLDKVYTEKLTLSSVYDPAIPNDLLATFT